MTDFAVLRAPSQVLFGVGMAAAAGRVAAEHGRRVLVITDPVIADTPGFATVRESLEGDVAVFADAAVDVPRSAIDAAVALGREHAPDVIVAVGGGSVIDLAKVTALLLAHGGALEDYYPVQSVPGPVLPLIALPDHRRHRFGGHAGLGHHRPEDRDEDRRREPAPDPAPRDLRPAADARRAATVTAHSGIDALSHAVEAYMAAREEPVARPRARPPAGRQEPALRHARADRRRAPGAQPRARRRGRLRPRGPHRDALRQPAGRDRVRQLRRVRRARAAVRGRRRDAHVARARHRAAAPLLHGVQPARRASRSWPSSSGCSAPSRWRSSTSWACRIGLPASLAEIGVAREDLRGMAEASVGIRRLIDNNPRPLDADALERILEAAWRGRLSAAAA